jgi:tyrosine-protein phosphatase non-receptor type 23
LDPFWPQNVNEEKSFGEISVTLQKQFELSHCFEKQLKLTRHGSDTVANVSLLQIKAWKKR